MFNELSYNSIGELAGKNFTCNCGKIHSVDISDITIESNALEKLSKLLQPYNGKGIMLVADQNTYNIAGKKLAYLVNNKYIFTEEFLVPDEKAVGRLLIEVTDDTSILVALGSGTINDITRLISLKLKIPYIIVCTAPSMDGYASVVSPLIVDSTKITYPAVYPKGIIGDINILKEAPINMIKAGIGDVIGKYTALCDWRLANIIEKEYYCDITANMVQGLVDECTENVNKIVTREPNAIKTLTEALVLSGLGIGFVGNSRPASGSEHLISHCWEMHFLSNKDNSFWLHGNKVGVGTHIVLQLCKFIINFNKEDIEKSSKDNKFDTELWNEDMKKLYGSNADNIIKHCVRIANTHREKSIYRKNEIINSWDEIIKVIKDTLEFTKNLEQKLDSINLVYNPTQLGISCSIFKSTLRTAKDLRDRYGILQLLQDVGLLEEAINIISNIYYV